MDRIKNVAVVAHDNCKDELLDFVVSNKDEMVKHRLIATGTTGKLVEGLLKGHGEKDIRVNRTMSGPLGGDQQLGAMIADGKVDILIFFWDPMQPQPHDVDVKALLRLAVLYNIPTASNRSSAEFLISSPFFNSEFNVKKGRFFDYADRSLD